MEDKKRGEEENGGCGGKEKDRGLIQKGWVGSALPEMRLSLAPLSGYVLISME